MFWYSLSVSVSAGATVIESPVCTPIGSRFSIEHTIIQLSFLSLITSISYSFQPSIDSIISISLIGEASIPTSASFLNSSMLYATPEPPPANVNDALLITGKPISLATLTASSTLYAFALFGKSIPILIIASLNKCLSSPFLIASGLAPKK
ncbi:MAG: Uncharacterised protein [Arcobacter lacus]|nr:MAG: Uncharacterised protein [Arcobacter lacus]